MYKDDWLKLLLYLGFLFLGVFFVLKAEAGMPTIVILMAFILLFFAGFLLASHLMRVDKDANGFLIAAIFLGVIAILMMIFSEFIANAIMPWIIGAVLFIIGVISLQSALGLRKLGAFVWWLPLISAVLAILLGLLIMTNTVATSMLISIFIGVFMVLYGALSIGALFTRISLRC